MATASLGKMVVELLLKDDQFQSAMGQAQGTMQSGGASLASTAMSVGNKITGAFKAASAAITAFGAASAVVGANFEQQMAMVGALQGLTQTDQAFQDLQDQARLLGSTTEFTATQAAEALEELARAGATVEESIQSSNSALTLAGTSAASLADSTQLLVATQRQFGLEATESERITNVFSQAMRNSLLDFTSIREAMKFAGTAGASFGMTLEETTASIAAFRDLGLEGSLAGTNFRMAMIEAAKGTTKQKDALAKYGLTMADINPEQNTFIDIVEKMGEVSLTAGDAVKIFGSRAGSNIAQLAAETAKGNVNMRAMTDTLLESSEAGNTAADMYETIGQTVAFQAKIAMSALQDLMIEVFDTFAGPLQELIATIPAVLNEVSVAVRAQGPQIAASFEETLGAISTFLAENATDLAEAFVNTLKLIAAMGPALVTLAELLVVVARNGDHVIAALAFGTVVVGIIKAAAAMKALAAAFGLGTSAAYAFGTALSITTGGLYAGIVAFTAIVSALMVYAKTVAQARQETEALAEAQAQQAKALQKAEDGVDIRIGRRLASTQKLVLAQRERLQQEGKLTDSMREEMDAILGLTKAQAVRQFREGKLISLGERLVTVQQALRTAGGKTAVLNLIEAQEKLVKSTEKRLKVAHRDSDLYKQLNGQLDEQQAKLINLQRTLADAVMMSEASATATNAETEAVRQLGQVSADEAERQKQLALKREDAARKIAALQVELASETARANQDVEGQIRADLDSRLAKVREVYNEALALAEGDAQAIAKLEADKARAEDQARGLAIKSHQDYLDEKVEAERQAAQEAADAQREAEERANDLLLALRGKALSKREQLEREKAKALEDLALAGAETRAAIAQAFDKEIQKAPKTLKEQIDALRKGFQRASKSAKRLAEAMGLVKEQAEDQPEKEIGKLGQAWQSVKQSVSKVLGPVGDVLGRVGKALGKVGKTYGDIGKAAFAFGKAATSAAMDAMGAISGLLNKLSGFQFSLTDAIGGALDAQNDALNQQADLVDQIADAEQRLAEAQADGDSEGVAEAQAALREAQQALQETEAQLAAGMPGFASDFVQALVDDAVRFAMALAEGAGPALATLAEQIPVLMEAVIAAIPQVVQALVDNIPTIIFGIVDALPDLITVLVQGLTTVLLTLFEQLPALLTALLTEVLPTLITEVAAALPVILQGLIDALPAIIQAMIDAIPVVVRAIVQALPDIITALADLLPEIIGLLIGALPMIAVALLDAILFELVPALPGIVAKLFEELIKGMGNALKAIAEGIWEAIKGFFNIFKKKDKGGKGGTAAFSGIDYVPATMRMTLHKGEAVVPADRNAQRMPGQVAPAAAGAAQNGMAAAGGGGGGPIDIAVIAEGRLLDAVQVQAMKRGGAVGVQNEIRRSSGVRIGLDRGRFNPWSK